MIEENEAITRKYSADFRSFGFFFSIAFTRLQNDFWYS